MFFFGIRSASRYQAREKHWTNQYVLLSSRIKESPSRDCHHGLNRSSVSCLAEAQRATDFFYAPSKLLRNQRETQVHLANENQAIRKGSLSHVFHFSVHSVSCGSGWERTLHCWMIFEVPFEVPKKANGHTHAILSGSVRAPLPNRRVRAL